MFLILKNNFSVKLGLGPGFSGVKVFCYTGKIILTDTMGSKPNLSVKRSVTIGTMEFFLNGADLSWNSANFRESDKSLKHELNSI